MKVSLVPIDSVRGSFTHFLRLRTNNHVGERGGRTASTAWIAVAGYYYCWKLVRSVEGSVCLAAAVAAKGLEVAVGLVLSLVDLGTI